MTKQGTRKLNFGGKLLLVAGGITVVALPLIFGLSDATQIHAQTAPATAAPIPAMAADANPSFEVAAIKPSKPGTPGRLLTFGMRGRHFITMNATLADMIGFAYGVQRQQIAGGQDWISADRYDIDAVPDAPGRPSLQQWRKMLQKLLSKRFQLKFHQEKRDLTLYAITVGKNGPKLTKSRGDPHGLPSASFPQLGVLAVRNATMADLAVVLQGAVFDRPVVDQTGLKDRYDFLLKWTPNENQFAAMGGYKPPATPPADAPPDVFTAIQEQLGLKLASTKAPVNVMVIDRVEKPSPN